MIRDLSASGVPVTRTSVQVCIIGAGTAGIFLARLLRQRGIAVTLLEAGDGLSKAPAEKEEYCEQKGLFYRGADNGRAFGLGGTSALWGGQMIPLSKSDFAARPKINFAAWPIDYYDVARFFPLVASAVGLSGNARGSAAEDEEIIKTRFPFLEGVQEEFGLRLSSWIPFGARNFSVAYANELKDDTGLDVWLNAAVVEICNHGSGAGHVAEVVARSPNGRELVVQPEHVVVAAGALESTRLLLAYDEVTGGDITRSGAPLGRYFADHLSVPCARFKCQDWKAFNQQVAPIFDRGVMRTPRLELTSDAQEKYGLSSAFAHFTFATKGQTGFDLVRSILRRRQGEQTDLTIKPSKLFSALVDVSSMVFWRYVYKRLWIPREADLVLQIDIEQLPNRDSRLLLSDERDKFGRKRLVVDWRITAEDVTVIKRVAELAMAAWENSPLHASATIELAIPDELDSFSAPYDVYHPTGSLRMGSTSSDSIVDGNLKLWASDNCFVTTTAVFPSAGSANPGMTHLALTARLAEHLSARLGAQCDL